MPFPQRKLVLQQPEVVDVGCGCRQSIFSTLFSALKQRIPQSLTSSSSSSTTSSSSTSISNFSSSKSLESVAIVKESFNPYHDFYESMLVMIMEKEIYCWKDLCDLLNRYLSLNSSCNHGIILRAFADVWNDVFSPPTAEDDGE